MQFDLLIQHGDVMDPGAGYQGRLDVAIKRNRIAAVDAHIPAESASKVIDARDQVVTPGLIDLHTHVYHGVTYWGIQADPVAARSGVTTWLDVGSAGAFNFLGFREFIVRLSQARLYALLNISSIGLTAPTWEHHNLAYCDVALCCQLADHNRDLILGIKVRVDRHTVGENGLEPLRRAQQAAQRCGLPLMVHIGMTPPHVAEVLPHLRPGDILTHCYTGAGPHMLDADGALLEVAHRAWNSGIILDCGHGAGSFSFEVAERLMSAGLRPDVISSDIHQISIHGPMFDLPTVMSKFMALGMSFAEVIRATTARPAEVLGLQREVGTLRPGALADVALFRLHQGRFPFYDVHMQCREGSALIRNTLTIVNGVPLVPTTTEQRAPWIDLTPDQRALHERQHTPAHLSAELT